MKECYIPKSFRDDALILIERINGIIDEYEAQGYTMTVRQVYYQLVAGDIVPNNLNSYKRVASVINDGKLAGLIDWDAMEDRTREFIRNSAWTSGRHILQSSAEWFHMDMWVNQPNRVFVVIEKEALVGVLEHTCRKFDVPLLAARGYPSGTVLREFVEDDVLSAINSGQQVTILHLGDHDPSGLDMTRDLRERVELFCANTIDEDEYPEVKRIALNMDQIRRFNPPPNPAKTTDARFKVYQRRFGVESWELDALKPQYLNDMVSTEIENLYDPDRWAERRQEIESIRIKLHNTAAEFEG